MYNDPRYQLLETTESPETGSTGYRYEHLKTGAQVLWLKNDDDNKAFGVGFRTPPTDSTGVAHIVEHSVLSGSRKFKGREPFMEMYKSSMQTFLNAMTFSDMTIYPISSKNDQDFLNLADVYLDAVFFPAIYDKPEIFMQEGWHYELFREEDPITYKGVVYNEMRGAYGNPERQVMQQMSQTMHPDGTYSHESGGFPYHVPELTEENFQAFHQRYYHPSNAFIYLYGDVPAEDIFNLIDEEYLSQFEKTEPNSEVVPGTIPSAPIKAEHYYNAGSGAKPSEESYFGYSVILGETTDLYDAFMQPLVSDVLISSESSPLKQVLLEKKFGQAILPAGSDGIFEEFGFVVKGADEARFDEFIEVTEATIRQMAEDGVDRGALLAALNRTEMSLRESGGSLKGIYFFIRSVGAHRYGVNPMDALNFNQTFDRIRADIENGGFEKYLKERILDNPAKVMTLHLPQAGQFQVLDDELADKLKLYKDSLTREEIRQLIADNERLLKYQQTEDSPEDKATIPKLDLNDIQREVAEIPSEKQILDNSTLLVQEYPSMGIRYLHLAFDLDFVTTEELPYLAYLGRLLGIVDTKQRGYSELNNEIYQVSSGFRFAPSVLRPVDGSNYALKMMVTTSALAGQSKRMFDILAEVLLETTFNDADRIKDVLQKMRSDMEMGFESSGHSVAANRASSYFSPTAKINEQLGGIDLFDHLQELLNDYDNRQAELMRIITSLYERIFTSKGLIAS
ncbi:MAG TPA: insulinase family protein, partial [Tissierellia bacterium]|nr:insulinase family protein [Tissierellia bacterium]